MAPAAAILMAAWTPVDFRLAAGLSVVPVVAGVLVIGRMAGRSDVATRAWAGLLGGVAGLLAYDAVRLALEQVGLVSQPFRAITLYGESLLPGSAAAAGVGWAYHGWNGLAFAVFFTLVIRRPTVLKAVGWALFLDMLQTLTVSEIPGLSVGREFLTASVVGHLAYGAALGLVAARFTERG